MRISLIHKNMLNEVFIIDARTHVKWEMYFIIQYTNMR